VSVPLIVSERSKPQLSVSPLSVGCLIFEQMDQIDFTGPFEVLSRMPDTTIQVIGKEVVPVRDIQGLRLFPDVSIAEAGIFDVLLVPGGHGQMALMHDEEVLELIREHMQRTKLLFSVCTGALLCGAGRRAYGQTGNHSLEYPASDAVLRSGSCGCKGRDRWQPHQRRRRNGWTRWGAGAGFFVAGRCCGSGDSACH
jgi:putative intracellular protease/amidase